MILSKRARKVQTILLKVLLTHVYFIMIIYVIQLNQVHNYFFAWEEMQDSDNTRVDRELNCHLMGDVI